MMEFPSEETLRKMPYSELRKYARKSGIKGNRKADDLIASILEKKGSCEDNFETIESKIINSSTKNKEDKFNADKKIASATPRRETYTIDSPMNNIVMKNEELISSAASPVLRKSPILSETSLNVTTTRGSEKKSKNRKVSFRTPIRRSERLSLLTPQFASVKDRPKTPIPSRISSGMKNNSFSNMSHENDSNRKYWGALGKVSGDGKERRPSTPMPVSKSERNKSSSGSLEKCAAPGLVGTLNIESPLPLLQEVDSEKTTPSSAIKRTHSPSSTAKRSNTTPRTSFKTPITKLVSSTKTKGTPNFPKIHEKGFDKLESLDDYSKRVFAKKEKMSKEQQKFHVPGEEKLKKEAKIPKPYGGIPFIPSVSGTICNFPSSGRKPKMTPGVKKISKPVSSENVPLKKKTIFDLKASLSKKLPYKPHRGPLKPLLAKDLNCTVSSIKQNTQEYKKENEVVKGNRIQSRAVLSGVRTNRRFELQMKNRKRISL